MKTLVIAEKPSVGVELAKLLGCIKREKGYMEGEAYIITWAIGHLVGLKYPEEHDSRYKKWRLEDLPFQFDISQSLKVLPKTKEQFKVIKHLMHRPDVSQIINAGDAGREGYLIQSWIYRMVENKKPVKVLWASSFTNEAVRGALENLKEDKIFEDLLREAETRAEADHMIGINYSRALSILNNKILAYGRCQTPLLKIITDRDREIEAFKSTPYYNVQITAQKDGNSMKAILVTEDRKRANLEDLEIAEKASELCRREKKGTVLSAVEAEKREHPPLLYNLPALQKDMGHRYGYSPDKTLEIAQKLYEGRKILSYPRTESQYLSTDLYYEINQHLESCRFAQYAGWIDRINMDAIMADKRYFNDLKVTDHYALIPTVNRDMAGIYEQLDEEERIVFDAVVTRFLCIFFPDHIYREQEVLLTVHNLLFLCRSKYTVKNGFKYILREEEKNGEKNNQFEGIQNGDTLQVMNVEILQKKTEPPKHYTADTLIGVMEKYGIGTAATRAEIIKKLQNPSRQFIRMENRNYLSTELGREFIDLIPDCLKEVDLTQKFEKKLKLVHEREISKQEFLDDIKNEFCRNLLILQSNAVGQQNIGKCPLCGGEIRAGAKNYYCEGYKAGCRFSISKNILGKTVSVDLCKKLLEEGETGIFKGFSGKKGKFDAKLILEDGVIKFKF